MIQLRYVMRGQEAVLQYRQPRFYIAADGNIHPVRNGWDIQYEPWRDVPLEEETGPDV